MPLRHRLSSPGVAPRPDARPCLKNVSPSAGARSPVPAPQSDELCFHRLSAVAVLCADRCHKGDLRPSPQRISSTATASRSPVPDRAPPYTVLHLLELAAPPRS